MSTRPRVPVPEYARRALAAGRRPIEDAIEGNPRLSRSVIVDRLADILLDPRRYVTAARGGKITDVRAIEDQQLALAAAHELLLLLGDHAPQKHEHSSVMRIEEVHELAISLESKPLDEVLRLAGLAPPLDAEPAQLIEAAKPVELEPAGLEEEAQDG